VEFEKITGDKQLDRGLFARQTAEGNYIVTGETLTCYQHGHGKLDAYLAEINTSGRVLWQSAIGGSGDDRGLYVNQTGDGGFIVTGATVAEISRKDNDVYLVKADPSGTIKWRKHFGGTGEDYGVGVEQTRDGGYILVGATNSQGAGDYDIYLIKFNAQGNKEWQKTFGVKEADLGVLVRQTSDGGYLVAGQTFSYASGGSDIYLTKTDPAGNRVWEKHYGRAGWDVVESLETTKDGGYIIAGQTLSDAGDTDVYLVKIYSMGNKQWGKTYGGSDWDSGKSVRHTEDGNYLVAGWSNSFGDGAFDFYLLKISAAGDKLWEKTLPGNKFDREFSIQPAGNDGYIITGCWTEPLGNQEYRNDDMQVYTAKISFVSPIK